MKSVEIFEIKTLNKGGWKGRLVSVRHDSPIPSFMANPIASMLSKQPFERFSSI